jgi:hypothetical protein
LLERGQIVADGSPQDLPRLNGEAGLTASLPLFDNRKTGNRRGQKKGPRL